ncbi:hypothetical protein COS61_01900 [Candidatus Wolfebacteria bacterium CG03_land_8_20_14_0_80_40_12]|uniref:Uncharacterized protein n=1 Tax=Candidatus Wolfebacteria bacterium CG03_land_8_20_14_0_80_40_12 TaxID=1975069 RepID=A0A2M7B5G0_9BACT|nr:MAG: hypothetical protein COS61_01900 [Candidatus Wolfebacteria bacterium CG03_land_8_20_14_0_80_40_12]
MTFKKRLLIIIGIPLGVCLVFAGASVFLGFNIAKLANQAGQLQGDLRFRAAAIESSALLRQDSEKAKYYSSELENLLLTQDQLIGFSSDLSMIARQNQVSVNSSLGQETVKSADEPGKIDFTIVGQGPFENFLGVLKILKNSRYFIKFKTLDFSRQDSVDFKTLLTGQVFSF